MSDILVLSRVGRSLAKGHDLKIPTDILQALVRAIELKDASTASHTWRVVLYARAMAERLGIERADMMRLTYAAALHDVGKIDIPEAILRKPERLDDEEFRVMRTHTTLGHERLSRMGEDDPMILGLVRHHHERWDGGGYPDNLTGTSIPLAARFFAVIDTFDAMTSIRPYRREVGAEAARRAIGEIESKSGTAYWPDAVDAFVELFSTGQLDWIMAHYNDESSVAEFAPDLASRVP